MRAHTSSKRDSLRAAIILRRAEGMKQAAVAEALSVRANSSEFRDSEFPNGTEWHLKESAARYGVVVTAYYGTKEKQQDYGEKKTNPKL